MDIYRPYLRTSGEHFADLAAQQDPRERGIATETAAAPSSAPTSPGPSPTATPATETAPELTTFGAEAAAAGPVGTYTPNAKIDSIYARYFQPYIRGIGEQQGALEGAQGAFRTGAEAGKSTYDQGILDLGITSRGEGFEQLDAEELAAAQELVDAAYTAPTGYGDLDQMEANYRGLNADISGLRSRLGVQASLGKQKPGLTLGQRKESAARILRDPAYQESLRGLEEDVGNLYSGIAGFRGEVADTNARRTAEEAAVSRQSRDYILGRQKATKDELTAQVVREQAERQRVLDAWAKFEESGMIEDLLPVSGHVFEGEPVAGKMVYGKELPVQNLLNEVPEIAKGREGQAAWDAIMAKYPQLKDVPLMRLGISSKGRERFEFPNDWYANNYAMVTPEFRAQATARQEELEGLFAPGTGKRGNDGQNLMTDAPYSDVLPMYFGNPEDLGESGDPSEFGFKPEQTQKYADIARGNMPSIGNMASDQQLAIINNVNDLMKNAERLEKSGQAYEAAKIAFNVTNFLENEHAALNAHKGKLTAGQAAWKQTVKHVRDKYKDKKWKRATKGLMIAAMGPYGFYPYLFQGTPAGENLTNFGAGTLEGGLS